jgi:hypothetical protein
MRWLVAYIAIPILPVVTQTLVYAAQGQATLVSGVALESIGVLGMRMAALSLLAVSMLLRWRLQRS